VGGTLGAMANPPPGGPTDRPRVPPPPTVLSNGCVVLVRTQGPVNLGMIARLCGNLGVTDLRLVAPECAVDCSEARMFSTHSRELLLTAPVYPDLASATADCGAVIGTSGDFRVSGLGASLRAEAVPGWLAQRPAAKWALVFGNEADGLDNAELQACHAYVHLDTFGINPSYNLSNAVAITLYVIATASVPVAPAEPPPVAASRAEVDGLYEYWLGTLERFGYFRRTDRARFAPLFARFLMRLHLSRHDLQVLRGMLAHFHLHSFGDRMDGKPGSPRAAAAAQDAGAPEEGAEADTPRS
jgi:TrmH family RNA methyltransferase